jgi:hypothetical protein
MHDKARSLTTRRLAPFEPRPRGRSRLSLRRVLAAAVLGFCVLFGFGIGRADYVALWSFVRAVDRWQVNPEFRTVAVEYSVRGSDAMRTRPMMVPARRIIMGLRSVPFLPERYALQPTHGQHYRDFSRGPLSAYLHLCDEQGVADTIPMVEELGRKPVRTDADLRAFLDSFKMDFPLVKDAGALRSADALVADADGSRPFVVRGNITEALTPHIRELSIGLGFPADPAGMTPAQQRTVLERLDAHVRRHDPELWRTKQVSDFCGGLWAQVFGQAYNYVLLPFLWLSAACRAAVVVLLVWLAVRYVRGRRRRGPAATFSVAPQAAPVTANADAPA